MKKIYGYPILNQQIKIIHVQEGVKKQKDKPDLAGFDVVFTHGKFVHACFLEKAPKEGQATADLVVRANFGEREGVSVSIETIKQ